MQNLRGRAVRQDPVVVAQRREERDAHRRVETLEIMLPALVVGGRQSGGIEVVAQRDGEIEALVRVITAHCLRDAFLAGAAIAEVPEGQHAHAAVAVCLHVENRWRLPEESRQVLPGRKDLIALELARQASAPAWIR